MALSDARGIPATSPLTSAPDKKLTDTSGIKFELFYDDLNNERFVSYGFPASYQTYVTEGRATYNFALNFLDDIIKTKSFVGASYRYTDAHLRESFNSGAIEASPLLPLIQ